MVGIGKDDLGLERVKQITDIEAFDTAYRTNWHKDGCFDRGVGGLDRAGSGIAARCIYAKFHILHRPYDFHKLFWAVGVLDGILFGDDVLFEQVEKNLSLSGHLCFCLVKLHL